MGELEKIQREAFEVYFDYGLTADYTLFDITRIFNTIAKEEPRKLEPEKNIAYFKALQLFLRERTKRKAEEKRKREEAVKKVQDDVDFLESVGVNVKAHINVEKIVPEIKEEPVVMEAVLDTEEAKFFEPRKQEVIVEEPVKEEKTIEVNEVQEEIKTPQIEEVKKEVKTPQIEEVKKEEIKIESKPKENIQVKPSVVMSELSYVDPSLTDIEQFAASYFEKPVKETKTVIYNDELTKFKTNLTEFEEVDIKEEPVVTEEKRDFSGILNDNYRTETDNFDRRYDKVSIDFGGLGNVQEEKRKTQVQTLNETEKDDDDPFIFGFTSIKK